jgi:hypothetical protein
MSPTWREIQQEGFCCSSGWSLWALDCSRLPVNLPSIRADTVTEEILTEKIDAICSANGYVGDACGWDLS